MRTDRKLFALSAAALACAASVSLAQQEGRPGGGRELEGFVDRMMQQDSNGDGKLSRDELTGRFADRLFESGDTNGDGMLDRAELETAARAFRPGGGAGDRGAESATEVPNFHEGMEQAGRAMRRLRRSEFDASSRVEDLEYIQTIQTGLFYAKLDAVNQAMAPQAEEKYGADTETYQKDLRLALVQALQESMALELAILKGEAETARASVEKLLDIQFKAHDAFQPEEDEEAAPVRGRPEPAAAPGRRPGGAGG